MNNKYIYEKKLSKCNVPNIKIQINTKYKTYNEQKLEVIYAMV